MNINIKGKNIVLILRHCTQWKKSGNPLRCHYGTVIIITGLNNDPLQELIINHVSHFGCYWVRSGMQIKSAPFMCNHVGVTS